MSYDPDEPVVIDPVSEIEYETPVPDSADPTFIQDSLEAPTLIHQKDDGSTVEADPMVLPGDTYTRTPLDIVDGEIVVQTTQTGVVA